MVVLCIVECLAILLATPSYRNLPKKGSSRMKEHVLYLVYLGDCGGLNLLGIREIWVTEMIFSSPFPSICASTSLLKWSQIGATFFLSADSTKPVSHRKKTQNGHLSFQNPPISIQFVYPQPKTPHFPDKLSHYLLEENWRCGLQLKKYESKRE